MRGNGFHRTLQLVDVVDVGSDRQRVVAERGRCGVDRVDVTIEQCHAQATAVQIGDDGGADSPRRTGDQRYPCLSHANP
jgi:hypothetical protein